MDFKRPARCRKQRTGREDRRSKFYEVSDNLSSNKNELWDFGVGVEVDSPLGSPTVIRLSTGHQFQAGRVPVVSRRQAKEFLDVVKCVEGAGAAINGELEAAALESMANSGGGTASEIKDLVALRDAGDLSQAEFEAAKARLLS